MSVVIRFLAFIALVPLALSAGQLALDVQGHVGRVIALGFTSDEKHLISIGTDDSIRIWDVVDGSSRLIRGYQSYSPAGRGYEVLAGTFSTKKGMIAVAGRANTVAGEQRGFLRLHLSDGSIYSTLEPNDCPRPVTAIAFSADGRSVALGMNDGKVEIRTVKDLQPIQSVEAGNSPIESISFADDGATFLVVSGAEATPSTTSRYVARLFDTQKRRNPLGFTGIQSRFSAFDKSTGSFVVRTARQLDFMDSQTGSLPEDIRNIFDLSRDVWPVQAGLLKADDHEKDGFAVSEDDQVLLFLGVDPTGPRDRDGIRRLCWIKPSRIPGRSDDSFERQPDCDREPFPLASLDAIAVSRSGDWRATSIDGSGAIIVRHKGDKPRELRAAGGAVTRLVFSRDRKSILVEFDKGRLGKRAIRFEDDDQPRIFLESQPYERNFSGDNFGSRCSEGRYTERTDGYRYHFCADLFGAIRVMADERIVRTPTLAGDAGIEKLALSDNEQTLIAGGVDGTVKVWRISTDDPPRLTLRFTIFIDSNGRWVVWTPQNDYAESAPGVASRYLSWLTMGGPAAPAHFASLNSASGDCARESAKLLVELYSKPQSRYESAEATVDLTGTTGCTIAEPMPPLVRTAAVAIAKGLAGSKSQAVTIQGSSTPTDPFQRLEVTVNNRTEIVRTEANNYKFDEQVVVPLESGRPNSIRAIGYLASNGRVESDLLQVDGPKAPRIQFKVLAIGVGNYKRAELHLAAPSKDAACFLTAFANTYASDSVCEPVLSSEYQLLSDASAQSIRPHLESFASGGDENTVRILYLSGHGDSKGFFAQDYEPGEDTTLIKWSEMTDALVGRPDGQVRPGRSVIIVDSCESGASIDGILKTGFENLAILASAKKGQQVPEGPAGMSVYTEGLVQLLLDAKSKGGTSLYELSHDLEVKMLARGPEVQPRHHVPDTPRMLDLQFFK